MNKIRINNIEFRKYNSKSKNPLYEIIKWTINLHFNKEEEYRKKLDDIHKEMKMDGNGSLKTAVVNLQNGQHQILYRLDGIEENIRTSMNLQGISYWVSDENGEFIYVSPNLCKLMERSESELLGNNWTTWVCAEDKARILDAWNFSVENKSAFDEIFCVRMPNGSKNKVWSTAFPKRVKKDMGGTIGKMVVTEKNVN